jgi:hypothetical protein
MDSISHTTLDSAIPTGSWTLYFHSSKEQKWTLGTYKIIHKIQTWNDYWTVVNTLNDDAFAEGMFFLMRDPIPPLWENHNNIRGGYYSFRKDKKDIIEYFITYSIACLLGNCVNDAHNKINGISISPKKGFNIIKIWNSDANKYNIAENFNFLIKDLKYPDIIYTPFVEKKL